MIYLDEDLLIYGVKAARSAEDIEIWLSPLLYEKVVSMLEEKTVKKYHIKRGRFGIAETLKYSMGLSYQLRKKLDEKPNHKKSNYWIKIIHEVIKKCVV